MEKFTTIKLVEVYQRYRPKAIKIDQ